MHCNFFEQFLLFKVPASFSTVGSRLSPNHTTCGLSRLPQWHCGKSGTGIRAAVACGSGALRATQNKTKTILNPQFPTMFINNLICKILSFHGDQMQLSFLG
jgi:hypothetical protein